MKYRLYEGLSEEEKMEAWHNGERHQNVKACSDDKLKMYYTICATKGFDTELEQLKAEFERRELPLPSVKSKSTTIYSKPKQGIEGSDLGSFVDDFKRYPDGESFSYNVSIHAVNGGLYAMLDSINEFIEQNGYSAFAKAKTSYGMAGVQMYDIFGNEAGSLASYGASVNGREIFLMDEWSKTHYGGERMKVGAQKIKKYLYDLFDRIANYAEKQIAKKAEWDKVEKTEDGKIKITDSLAIFNNAGAYKYYDKYIAKAPKAEEWCQKYGFPVNWEKVNDSAFEIRLGLYNDYFISLRLSFGDLNFVAKPHRIGYSRKSKNYYETFSEKPKSFVKKFLIQEGKLSESYDEIESRLFESLI